MPDSEPADQLPEKDRLLTRPDPEPLPAVQDPAVHGTSADPKPAPPGGQGTDPRRDEIDYSV